MDKKKKKSSRARCAQRKKAKGHKTQTWVKEGKDHIPCNRPALRLDLRQKKHEYGELVRLEAKEKRKRRLKKARRSLQKVKRKIKRAVRRKK